MVLRGMKLSTAEKELLRFLYDWIRPIRPGDIRKHIDVKHSTLNFQLEALQNKGVLTWEKYGPVSLTEEGKEVASHHLRHVALLELFLIETLALDKELAHKESMRVAPLIDCRVAEAIDAFLKNPQSSSCCGEIPPEEVCRTNEQMKGSSEDVP